MGYGRFTDTLASSVLDSLSAHVAILDDRGVILETNGAWKAFARQNKIQMRPDTLDINYLEICRAAFEKTSGDAAMVYQGITDLISGRIQEFVIEYSCHSPDEKRWFYMRATRLVHGGRTLVVVSHENITPLRLALEELEAQKNALKAREAELETQAVKLTEANTALKVVLDQREKEKKEQKEDLVSQIREEVFPCLEKLLSSGLDRRQQVWAGIIQSCLEDMVSPFYRRFSSLKSRLTPREIQIALFVKEGHTTKEIAHILGCSVDAVEFHRKNIRKKLGLTHKKANLRTHLLSLS